MIQTLTIENAQHIARLMRTRDQHEVLATMDGDDLVAWAMGMVGTRGEAESVHADDGEPVVMGGVVRAWPGLAQTWMVATDRIEELGPAVHKWAVRFHERWAERGIRRFHCTPIEGSLSIYWLRRLGYQEEGRHPGFGKNGETFVTMGKVV